MVLMAVVFWGCGVCCFGVEKSETMCMALIVPFHQGRIDNTFPSNHHRHPSLAHPWPEMSPHAATLPLTIHSSARMTSTLLLRLRERIRSDLETIGVLRFSRPLLLYRIYDVRCISLYLFSSKTFCKSLVKQ